MRVIVDGGPVCPECDKPTPLRLGGRLEVTCTGTYPNGLGGPAILCGHQFDLTPAQARSVMSSLEGHVIELDAQEQPDDGLEGVDQCPCGALATDTDPDGGAVCLPCLEGVRA